MIVLTVVGRTARCDETGARDERAAGHESACEFVDGVREGVVGVSVWLCGCWG